MSKTGLQLHFLFEQIRNDLCGFAHAKIIGLDAEIIIFHISPVGFRKVLAVNRTLMIYLFHLCGSSLRRNVVACTNS